MRGFRGELHVSGAPVASCEKIQHNNTYVELWLDSMGKSDMDKIFGFGSFCGGDFVARSVELLC